MSNPISSETNATSPEKELQQLRQELADIDAQSERQQQRKASLLAMAAHDLRTPLAIIQGYAQLLASEPALAANKDVTDFLDNIIVHADALGIMLENLFSLDQLDRHALHLLPSRVELIELVAQAIAQTEGLARVKGITFDLQREERAALWVNADAAQIERVLYNMLGHTIKYGRPHAALLINICQGDGFARLELRDPHRFLAPEIVAQLFDPIETPHTSISSLRGMDMGLVLARQVVKAHGGIADANCEPGRGVTLCLRLPLAAE